MHQEREYPGRVVGTQLRNPDFAAYARAFGGHGETVETTEEFEPAFERALAAGLPAILHVKVDPEAITPTTTLTAIREAALKRSRGQVTARSSRMPDDVARLLGRRGRRGRGAGGLRAGPLRLRLQHGRARASGPGRWRRRSPRRSRCSARCWGSSTSLASVRARLRIPRGSRRSSLGGVVGVPIGVFVLHNVDPPASSSRSALF